MHVEKSAPTVFTALEDETGVLLNLETLFYYSLNKTGAALWQEIEQGGKSDVELLAAALCKRFDVDERAARQETIAFITNLSELKIVRIV